MRLNLLMVCVALLVGCRSAPDPRDASAGITTSLERQITVGEAQRIACSYFEFGIQAARASSVTNLASRDELQILESLQQRNLSKLESFLSHKKSGDELWTYLTAGPGCRESGFALVRDGNVVRSLGMMIYD
jgi:hypothetical protein